MSKSVLELIQPERERIEKAIALSKDLQSFHNQLAEKEQRQIDEQEVKLKELDKVLEKILELYKVCV